LDVHTSQWVVDQCLAGDLLKGRTVILVTHNIQLARRVAEYLVILNSNGTLQSQGNIEKVLKDGPALKPAIDAPHVTQEKEDNAIGEEEQELFRKGRQIMAEDVAIGHVGWPSCESLVTYLIDTFGIIQFIYSF